MENLSGLKKQILYLVNKLENSRYFLTNEFYKRNIANFYLEIVKKENIRKCFLYNKITNELLYNIDYKF